MEATENAVVEPKLTDFQKWQSGGAEEVQDTPETEAAEPVAEVEPEAAPETDGQEPDEEDDKKLPKGLKKRFSKLTGKNRELQAQIDQLRAEKTPTGTASQPEAEKPPQQAQGKPELANFATLEDWTEALTEWKIEQRDAKKQQAESQRTQADSLSKKFDSAREKYDDFDEVALNPKLTVSGVMASLMQEGENGMDVLHHLGKNPKLALEISNMSPAKQALAIGKLDAQFDSKPDPETATATSKAPKPAKALSGTAATDAGKEPDPKDFKKWNAWKDRQERSSRD